MSRAFTHSRRRYRPVRTESPSRSANNGSTEECSRVTGGERVSVISRDATGCFAVSSLGLSPTSKPTRVGLSFNFWARPGACPTLVPGPSVATASLAQPCVWTLALSLRPVRDTGGGPVVCPHLSPTACLQNVPFTQLASKRPRDHEMKP